MDTLQVSFIKVKFKFEAHLLFVAILELENFKMRP
jgi:hypothetical protein